MKYSNKKHKKTKTQKHRKIRGGTTGLTSQPPEPVSTKLQEPWRPSISLDKSPIQRLKSTKTRKRMTGIEKQKQKEKRFLNKGLLLSIKEE